MGVALLLLGNEFPYVAGVFIARNKSVTPKDALRLGCEVGLRGLAAYPCRCA